MLEREDQMVVEELTETLKEWNKALRKHFIQAHTDKLVYSLRVAFKCTSTSKHKMLLDQAHYCSYII